jgi:hypothetical protein
VAHLEYKTGKLDQECLLQNEQAVALVTGDKTVQTVVLACFWSTPLSYDDEREAAASTQTVASGPRQDLRSFERGLDAMVSTLRRAGKRVILVQDSPLLQFDTTRRHLGMVIPGRRWVRSTLRIGKDRGSLVDWSDVASQQQAPFAAIVQEVAAKDGAEVFDPEPQMCRPAGCLYEFQGRFLYMDSNHLSEDGAALALTGLQL